MSLRGAGLGVAAIATLPLLAHTGAHDEAWRWRWDPVILPMLAVSALLYARGAMRMRALRAGHIAAFAGGWLTLFVAQISPLDPLSDFLFSAHMTQHELLILVAAPLLVLGRPLAPMLRGLPQSWRVAVTARLRQGRGTWRWLTGALTVFLLHAVVMLVWHIPVFYQAAIRSETTHFVQHTMFLGTAGLFWWALVHGRYGRLGYGVAVLFVFGTALYSGALGALITFAPRLLYPIYETRTKALHIDPIADQQLAGLIMWIPAGAILIVVGLALFAAWLGAVERRAALLLVLAAVLVPLTAGCHGSRSEVEQTAAALTGGDPVRGELAIRQYGCYTCHTIPGIRGADAVVGPPLDRMGLRMYIAGERPNTPDNLVQWIRAPESVHPRTAMPNTGVTEEDARHIAAYLYTLR